ncbi:MAG: DUF853 domain-containing protein [Neomegalonema sp.]|nr:DUF853 domain-containing protein [Neomegalonema sp.]
MSKEQEFMGASYDPELKDRLFVGGAGSAHRDAQSLLLKFGNRHGLIAGATGTGKTVTLQILAEGFAQAGVPVFMADVKGDLSGMAASGSPEHKLHEKLVERADKIGFSDYGYDAFPVVFWDLFGQQGHPVRATVSEMGPLLLSRMLDLNEVQEGILNIVFRVADDEGMLLVDLKDLRAMLHEVAENASTLQTMYGSVSKASVGAIQRRLLVLENQGADQFFGEPALKLEDLMRVGSDGRGQVNILAADVLMRSPRLYATFLLWLLSELFEELPEVGDPDKPKLAFFFDEAHLLFDDAPKALMDKVEQVARLIRSKGVGVYFITQNPADVPDDILGQLGNRVQHALRAYTPRDRRALKAAAETFRENPDFDTADVITQLGVGEALVSTLETKGAPSIVQRTLIRPPSSQIGPIDADTRARVIAASPVIGLYEETVDRASAFEILKERAEQSAAAAEDLDGAEEESWEEYKARTRSGAGRDYSAEEDAPSWRREKSSRSYEREKPARSSKRQSVTEAFVKSMARSVGTRLGKSLIRGVLGGLFKGR